MINVVFQSSLRPRMTLTNNIRFGFLLLLLVAAGALVQPRLALAVPQTSAQDGTLNGRIQSLSGKVGALQRKIDGLQQRQNSVQADLNQKVSLQQKTAAQLADSRIRLAKLKADLAHAKLVLGDRLAAVYMSGQPNALTALLETHGFAEMIERANYMHQVAEQDKAVINGVRDLQSATVHESVHLALLEKSTKVLVAQARDRRDELAGAKGKLATQMAPLSTQLAASKHRLAAINASVNREQNAANPSPGRPGVSPFHGNSSPKLVPGGSVVLNSDGSASAPINAPGAIQSAVAAGNQIRNTPYLWGGGHGSFSSSGYDCSGSVSYVLHGAGILSSPLASGGLESWGSAGPGRWITVYANGGHVFMSVGGVWFDTSGIGGNGSRWQGGSKSTGGYVVRHWPGL